MAGLPIDCSEAQSLVLVMYLMRDFDKESNPIVCVAPLCPTNAGLKPHQQNYMEAPDIMSMVLMRRLLRHAME